MEPVGVSRKLALMPAGHTNGGVDPLRVSGAVREAISIRENIEFHHENVADGYGDKCGKLTPFRNEPGQIREIGTKPALHRARTGNFSAIAT